MAIIVSVIPSSVSAELGQATLICGILFAFFYILFADGFRGGQSYGKRIMKTAVIDATTGAPCNFGKSFVRNLLLSLLGIIDWAFIFGRKRQRLGDIAANTIVVKVSREYSIGLTIAGADARHFWRASAQLSLVRRPTQIGQGAV